MSCGIVFCRNNPNKTISTGILMICSKVSFSRLRLSINARPLGVVNSTIINTIAGAIKITTIVEEMSRGWYKSPISPQNSEKSPKV